MARACAVTGVEDFPHEIDNDDGLFRNSDTVNPSALKKAAVLVPLIRMDDEWHLLFIVRASNPNDRHSGQVAFPGGRQDDTDTSLVHTALRETEEEIGVSAKHISVLGSLSAYVTVSDYAVTPVIAVMDWPQELRLQADEVARTLTLPIQWLGNRSNFSLRARNEMEAMSQSRHPVVVYRENNDAVLWGATARMTLNCLKAFADGELSVSPPVPITLDQLTR